MVGRYRSSSRAASPRIAARLPSDAAPGRALPESWWAEALDELCGPDPDIPALEYEFNTLLAELHISRALAGRGDGARRGSAVDVDAERDAFERNALLIFSPVPMEALAIARKTDTEMEDWGERVIAGWRDLRTVIARDEALANIAPREHTWTQEEREAALERIVPGWLALSADGKEAALLRLFPAWGTWTEEERLVALRRRRRKDAFSLAITAYVRAALFSVRALLRALQVLACVLGYVDAPLGVHLAGRSAMDAGAPDIAEVRRAVAAGRREGRATAVEEFEKETRTAITMLFNMANARQPAIMCPRCLFGPIIREACDDMEAHHGVPWQRWTDNRCPNEACRYFHGTLREPASPDWNGRDLGGWLVWDGIVRSLTPGALFGVLTCTSPSACDFLPEVGKAPPREPCWPYAVGDRMDFQEPFRSCDNRHVEWEEMLDNLHARGRQEARMRYNRAIVGQVPWESAFRTNQAIDLSHEAAEIAGNAHVDSVANLVRFAPTLVYIAENAFHGSALVRLDLPDSVLAIGAKAFAETQNLAAVWCGENLQAIGASAFYGSGVRHVELNPRLRVIGPSAFASADGLTSVAFGAELESIGASAFEATALRTLTLPDSVRKIDTRAFASCHLGGALRLPSSLTALGAHAFESNELEEVALAAVEMEHIPAHAFRDNKLSRLTLPDALRSIGAGAFQNNSLVELRLGPAVHTIGVSAFAGNELAVVHLGSALQTIGTAAFAGNALGEVRCPSSLRSIDDGAFADAQVTKLNLNVGLLSIGASAFARCRFVVLLLPMSLTSVGTGAFAYSALQQVDLEITKLRSIPKECFRGSQLERVVLPSALERVEALAFAACTNLRRVQLPASLQHISNSAFDGCRLHAVSLAHTRVVHIDDFAFADNATINTLTLPPTLRSIGIAAFQGNALAELTLPSALDRLGWKAFAANRLTSLALEQTAVTRIPAECFARNALAVVTFPAALESIGASAFQENALLGLALPTQLRELGTNAFRGNGELDTVLVGIDCVLSPHAFDENVIVTRA